MNSKMDLIDELAVDLIAKMTANKENTMSDAEIIERAYSIARKMHYIRKGSNNKSRDIRGRIDALGVIIKYASSTEERSEIKGRRDALYQEYREAEALGE